MSEFTKGQWTADDMGEYVFAHGFDMMICQMRGWAYLKAQSLSDNQAIEVQKANARLIAAAPDMYKALTLAMDFLRDGNFPAQLIADRIQVLLARIDGKDADDD